MILEQYPLSGFSKSPSDQNWTEFRVVGRRMVSEELWKGEVGARPNSTTIGPFLNPTQYGGKLQLFCLIILVFLPPSREKYMENACEVCAVRCTIRRCEWTQY